MLENAQIWSTDAALMRAFAVQHTLRIMRIVFGVTLWR